MKILPILALAALPLLSLTSCGSSEEGGSRAAAKSRGSASMVIGDLAWTGSSAYARIKNTKLTLTFAASEKVGKLTVRDNTNLVIENYTGPGTYKGGFASNFVRVSMDMGKYSDENANSEENAESAVLDALGDAVMLTLAEAEIVIEEADDEVIQGTFSFNAPGEDTQYIKSVKDGKFSAKVKN